jgi:hypothetical protein
MPTTFAAATQGLYFLGLPWLYTWAQAAFSGVKVDAEHLLEHVLPKTAEPQLGTGLLTAAL